MLDWSDLSASSWRAFSEDPLPGWASRAGTLFDVSTASLDGSETYDVAVCSVPWDSTASTRIGARTGPAALRQASIAYAAQAKSRGAIELLNLRTGACVRPRILNIADFGDLHTYPCDIERQLRASAAEVFAIGSRAKQVVTLGGEHTISYPVVAGLRRALADKLPGARLGYVQIDHHFDFGDRSSLHGRYYHGSNGRRISELSGMDPRSMGFVGMGDLTPLSQFRGMLASGFAIRTMLDIRARGFSACLAEVCDSVLQACDCLYVSIDIDVCDLSVAPGTGHATVGGICAADFVAIADVLRGLPVFGVDLVEVNSQLDPTGSTAHLAARLLFELLLLEACTASP